MAHVLIVDDDRVIRELLQFALACEGYDVDTLCDGTEVIAALTRMSDPCVVLMDLMMPHVDGWAVCSAWAAHESSLTRHRLVVMTAFSIDEGDRPAPASALLRKPFELERVVNLVAELSHAADIASINPPPGLVSGLRVG